MLEMYPGMVNSPITELAAAIDETQTTIEVIDGTKLPDAPNLAIIGLGEDAETILYTEKTGNVLSGVTRGFQGVAKAWGQGARIARFFTEYDQRAMMQNIQENADNLASHLNDKTNPHGVTAEQVGAVRNTGDTMTGNYVIESYYPLNFRHPNGYKSWIIHRPASEHQNGLIFAPRKDDNSDWDWDKAISFTDYSAIQFGRMRTIIMVGTGSPEGNVVAAPGSIFLGSNGTVYVKVSGTGNTGWKAVQVS